VSHWQLPVVSASALFGQSARIVRDRNVQLLLTATLFPVLGTALVSPVLDSLIVPLDATAASIGLMISVFTAPAIVMIPIAGDSPTGIVDASS
jgi:ACDE family multidrug resistance protein